MKSKTTADKMFEVEGYVKKENIKIVNYYQDLKRRKWNERN